MAPPFRQQLQRRIRTPLVRSLIPQHAAPPGGGTAPGTPHPPITNPYDYSADPTDQRIRAVGQRNVGDAEAQALAARKQLAIDQGDPSLAPDEQTAAAARANPFSALAGLARRRETEPRALTEADNAQNLFYSGAGAKHQSDLVRSLLEAETGIQAQGRARSSEIQAGLLSARQGASDAEAQAQEEAAARLQARLGDLPLQGGAPQAIGGPLAAHIRRRGIQILRPPRAPRPANQHGL